DLAVELADELGEEGAMARAVGDGKAVLDACRALHRRQKDEAAARELSARAHGMRGRLAARTGDYATAREDLERIPHASVERATVDAVIRLNRGDFAGAARAFVTMLQGPQAKLPHDATLDFAIALEFSGDEASAHLAYDKIVEVDPIVAPFAKA